MSTEIDLLRDDIKKQYLQFHKDSGDSQRRAVTEILGKYGSLEYDSPPFHITIKKVGENYSLDTANSQTILDEHNSKHFLQMLYDFVGDWKLESQE